MPVALASPWLFFFFPTMRLRQMLKFTLITTDNCTVTNNWSLGDELVGVSSWDIMTARNAMVTVSGDEYDYVTSRFANLPVTQSAAVKGWFSQSGRVINFHGDMAKFILSNLGEPRE